MSRMYGITQGAMDGGACMSGCTVCRGAMDGKERRMSMDVRYAAVPWMARSDQYLWIVEKS